MNKLKRGLFITFEATGEKVGKTTQAKLLFDTLQKVGICAVLTREPGGTELGKTIRELLLFYKGNMSKACELLLYEADRAQNYKEVIKPALIKGQVVISDRYFDSSLAYQGAGRGWSHEKLLQLHDIATNGLLPDLTVILDGVTRCAPDMDDRLEKMIGTNFFTRVRDGLLRQSRTADRYVVLDANKTIEEISSEVNRIVRERFDLSF